jgi:hypothetical protein
MSITFENAHNATEIPEHTMITCYLALKGGIHALAFYSPRIQSWVDNGAIQPIEIERIVAWWYLPKRAVNVEVKA